MWFIQLKTLLHNISQKLGHEFTQCVCVRVTCMSIKRGLSIYLSHPHPHKLQQCHNKHSIDLFSTSERNICSNYKKPCLCKYLIFSSFLNPRLLQKLPTPHTFLPHKVEGCSENITRVPVQFYSIHSGLSLN